MIRMLINWLNKMPLLGSSELISTRQIFFTMFAFANFIIALLYHGIRFNSSRTLRGRTPWVDRNAVWRLLSYFNGKYLKYLAPYS
jgi:hypothetical protein